MAQRSQPIGSTRERAGIARNEGSDDPADSPREEKGRLSNPTQQRLSPSNIADLIAAYDAGATISQLAAEFGIHRTTVAARLDRHQVPRHRERSAWDDDTLNEAAELYATGLSLADVAHQFGIDAQTVANRFRHAGVPVRPRRGWVALAHPQPGNG